MLNLVNCIAESFNVFFCLTQNPQDNLNEIISAPGGPCGCDWLQSFALSVFCFPIFIHSIFTVVKKVNHVFNLSNSNPQIYSI